MRFEEPRDTYVLSSGREFYANHGILGLGPEEDPLVSEGFDGSVEYIEVFGKPAVASQRYDPESEKTGFTPAERQEIAEEMIRRWTRWAEAT